jgi:hypothetical protein
MRDFILIKIEYGKGKSIYRRYDDEDILIGSSQLSRLHLGIDKKFGVHSIIKNKDGKLSVLGLKQDATIKLNGKDVTNHPLKHGDVIDIEKYKLTILCPNEIKKIRDFKDAHCKVEDLDISKQNRKIAFSTLGAAVFVILMLIVVSLVDIPDEVPIEKLPERFARLVVDPTAIQEIATGINPRAGDGENGDGSDAPKQANTPQDVPKSKSKIKISKAMRKKVHSKGVLAALGDSKVKKQMANILKQGLSFSKKFSKTMSVKKYNEKTDRRLAAISKGSGSRVKSVNGGKGGTSRDLVGKVGTKGRGGGKKGYGKGVMGRRIAANVQVDDVNTVIKGALEREEIERVIKRNLPQIRYCYERELKLNPNLNGKVVSHFTIGKTGGVVSANIMESTLQGSAVGTCIARRISRWVFPKPRGGGIVRVKYPFLFQSVHSKERSRGEIKTTERREERKRRRSRGRSRKRKRNRRKRNR